MMWPINLLKRRTYERRYKAALVVLLGTYMFDGLNPDQRTQVDSEVDANLNRTDTPAVAWRRFQNASELMAAFRAVAMEKRGIAPAVADLSWAQLFEPWAFWRVRRLWPVLRGFDFLPINLIHDYRPMHQATADARTFLKRKGMSIPDFDSRRQVLTSTSSSRPIGT